jgi:hypothetical protein
MLIKTRLGSKAMLLGGFLVGGILLSSGAGQTPATPGQTTTPPTTGTTTPAASAKKPVSTGKPTVYRPNRFSKRAEMHYTLVWGVDDLAVKWTESGEVIRFTYHVLDPVKAKAINDKKNEPSLIDPRAGVKLSVPALEKVGQLRQTGTPKADTSYWMAFSNVGRLVKRGDHVDVVIGPFRAEGLVVD